MSVLGRAVPLTGASEATKLVQHFEKTELFKLQLAPYYLARSISPLLRHISVNIKKGRELKLIVFRWDLIVCAHGQQLALCKTTKQSTARKDERTSQMHLYEYTHLNREHPWNGLHYVSWHNPLVKFEHVVLEEEVGALLVCSLTCRIAREEKLVVFPWCEKLRLLDLVVARRALPTQLVTRRIALAGLRPPLAQPHTDPSASSPVGGVVCGYVNVGRIEATTELDEIRVCSISITESLKLLTTLTTFPPR